MLGSGAVVPTLSPYRGPAGIKRAQRAVDPWGLCLHLLACLLPYVPPPSSGQPAWNPLGWAGVEMASLSPGTVWKPLCSLPLANTGPH